MKYSLKALSDSFPFHLFLLKFENFSIFFPFYSVLYSSKQTAKGRINKTKYKAQKLAIVSSFLLNNQIKDDLSFKY